MKIYLITDTTAGNINKLVNTQGLIEYANGAHFITEPVSTIEDAISVLQADMFSVDELDISDNEIFIRTLEIEG